MVSWTVRPSAFGRGYYAGCNVSKQLPYSGSPRKDFSTTPCHSSRRYSATRSRIVFARMAAVHHRKLLFTVLATGVGALRPAALQTSLTGPRTSHAAALAALTSATSSRSPAAGAAAAPARRASSPPLLSAAAPASGAGGSPEGRRLFGMSLSVFATLAAAFLNLLGFTMAGPITPALGSHFGLDVGASLGALTSAYPLGMLAGLFLWPALSDRVGRKPVIALSLLGSGLGLAAQGLAVQAGWSLSAFLMLRVLTGSMAGASPVAKAYLADLGSRSGRLPQYMAWRDAASTLAFIIGPLVSGQLYLGRKALGFASDRSLAAVISTSGVGSLLAALLIFLCVEEVGAAAKGAASTASAPAQGAAVPDTTAAPVANEELIACPLGRQLVSAVATVCLVSALFNAGSAPFDAFFPSLMKNLAGFDEGGIGQAKAALASLSLVVSAGLAAPLQRRLGAVVTCVLGLLCSAAGLGGVAVVASARVGAALSPGLRLTCFWLSAGVFQLGVPLYGPTIPTMLLQCVPRHRRGAIMGLDSSLNTVARILAAPILGAVWHAGGPGACFAAASGVLLLSALTTILRRVWVLRGLYAD